MFTIGCDPEVFVTKGGEAVSAYGMIPGTKEEPFPVPSGAVQVDGMALEFNTDPVPLTTPFELSWLRGLNSVENSLKSMIGSEYELKVSPVQDFSEEFLADQPREAVELGCDPDYNAYTLLMNPSPDARATFRTAAGHIHVGWGADIPATHPDHIKICADFVKMLDATVGLYMTLIDPDFRRRDLYGKAGAFRPKSYGVEYRTPSNAWLVNEDRRKTIFKLTGFAVEKMKEGKSPRDVINLSEILIQDFINLGDFHSCFYLLQKYTLEECVKHFEEEYAKREARA